MSFRYCYLDMFLNLFFIPIAVLCCLWFPAYYGYKIIFDACVGNLADLNQILITIAIILFCAFLIPFIAQAFLVYALDRKKIGVPLKKLLPTMFAFPMFMIIYAISIVIGVFSKPQWKQVSRNVNFANNETKSVEKKSKKHFFGKKKKLCLALKANNILRLAKFPIRIKKQEIVAE